MITKHIIRRAIENNRKWVLELYFDNRPYPNLITGRYKTKKDCLEAMYQYQETGTLKNWGEY